MSFQYLKLCLFPGPLDIPWITSAVQFFEGRPEKVSQTVVFVFATMMLKMFMIVNYRDSYKELCFNFDASNGNHGSHGLWVQWGQILLIGIITWAIFR